MSFTYYIVDENSIAHTVIELPEQVDLSLFPEYVEADNYDVTVLRSRRVGTTWEAPPTPWHDWDPDRNTWANTELESIQSAIAEELVSAVEGNAQIAELEEAIENWRQQLAARNQSSDDQSSGY